MKYLHVTMVTVMVEVLTYAGNFETVGVRDVRVEEATVTAV